MLNYRLRQHKTGGFDKFGAPTSCAALMHTGSTIYRGAA